VKIFNFHGCGTVKNLRFLAHRKMLCIFLKLCSANIEKCYACEIQRISLVSKSSILITFFSSFDLTHAKFYEFCCSGNLRFPSTCKKSTIFYGCEFVIRKHRKLCFRMLCFLNPKSKIWRFSKFKKWILELSKFLLKNFGGY